MTKLFEVESKSRILRQRSKLWSFKKMSLLESGIKISLGIWKTESERALLHKACEENWKRGAALQSCVSSHSPCFLLEGLLHAWILLLLVLFCFIVSFCLFVLNVGKLVKVTSSVCSLFQFCERKWYKDKKYTQLFPVFFGGSDNICVYQSYTKSVCCMPSQRCSIWSV